MPHTDILLGLQWGDEGKGKIVDVLSQSYGVVARFQGGPNAGHTIHFDGKKLTPSALNRKLKTYVLPVISPKKTYTSA